MRRTPVPAALIALTALLLAAVLASCSGAGDGGGDASSEADGDAGNTPAGAATPTEAEAAALDFPSGPAATVPEGYEPPTDRVDSTGAFLPFNGRPTLVFVDAIW